MLYTRTLEVYSISRGISKVQDNDRSAIYRKGIDIIEKFIPVNIPIITYMSTNNIASSTKNRTSRGLV